jgi:hypothetical protein
MRKFSLIRTEDYSGVSGTGHVAEGVMYDDGTCAVSWTVPARLCDGSKKVIKTTTFFECWQDVVLLHGHDGRTFLMWNDTGLMLTDRDLLLATTVVTKAA